MILYQPVTEAVIVDHFKIVVSMSKESRKFNKMFRAAIKDKKFTEARAVISKAKKDAVSLRKTIMEIPETKLDRFFMYLLYPITLPGRLVQWTSSKLADKVINNGINTMDEWKKADAKTISKRELITKVNSSINSYDDLMDIMALIEGQEKRREKNKSRK